MRRTLSSLIPLLRRRLDVPCPHAAVPRAHRDNRTRRHGRRHFDHDQDLGIDDVANLGVVHVHHVPLRDKPRGPEIHEAHFGPERRPSSAGVAIHRGRAADSHRARRLLAADALRQHGRPGRLDKRDQRAQKVALDYIPVESSEIPPGGQFVWSAHFGGSYTYHSASGMHARLILQQDTPVFPPGSTTTTAP